MTTAAAADCTISRSRMHAPRPRVGSSQSVRGAFVPLDQINGCVLCIVWRAHTGSDPTARIVLERPVWPFTPP